MPIFISYSHADKQFVDNLAVQLVAKKVYVWFDKWEIHAGDSLLTKVQNAIGGASALLVVLSKASVKSEWCTKELNAGLMRELDEKRVIVVPILVQDCQVPTFLREKFYADFRTNFDSGLNTILESIARITNESQGRVEAPTYHTDWAIDWGTMRNRDVFRLTMIDHSKEQPYTILGEATMIPDGDASKWYAKQERAGNGELARREIILALEAALLDDEEFDFWLSDQMPQHKFTTFELHDGIFGVSMIVRRLGTDTGRDILFRMGGQVRNVGETIREITRSEKNDSTDSGPPKGKVSKKSAGKKSAKKQPKARKK